MFVGWTAASIGVSTVTYLGVTAEAYIAGERE